MVQTRNFLTPGGLTRGLLRMLRDLNLCAGRVAVSRTETVAFDGCLSVDAPVEHGVRYRLRESGGQARVLSLVADEDRLEIRLGGPGAGRQLVVGIQPDERGRATSHELAARLDLEQNDPRVVEHFLRRVVRGVYAA